MQLILFHSNTCQRLIHSLLLVAILLGMLIPAYQVARAAPPIQQQPQEIPNTVEISIEKSDNRMFIATIHFPAAQVMQVRPGDGNLYGHMLVPGIDPQIGAVGKPDIPTVRRLIGVPRGAKIEVTNVQRQVRTTASGLLYPIQTSPKDQEEPDPNPEYDNQPFVRDTAIYSSDTAFPEQIVQVRRLGRLRDLEVAQISIAAAQFNPAGKEVTVFDSVRIAISFGGDENNHFRERGTGDSFERPGLTDIVINYQAVDYHVIDDFRPKLCLGYEYLIITDPAFRAAADTLADRKNLKGISTGVFETGSDASDAGVTALEIQAFIRNKYENCMVRPSYILLLGDAEFIPPFYRNLSNGVSAGTDLDYGLMDTVGLLPDLAVGRMPVDTLDQAQLVVDKSVNYEQNPPRLTDFYDKASLASYFQCCRNDVASDGTDMRSFIETSELVRDFLLSKNFDVERIYTTNDKYADDPASDDYYPPSRDATPRRYYNGTLLPADLGAGSGFAWNGSTSDVVDAFNDGRFLVIHRDHGSKSGWGDPSFSVSTLSQLTNTTELAVVYSINCSSGLFDNETNGGANSTTTTGVYWAESLLRSESGAVGIIGDTRASGTWVNSALMRGLIDATWPQFVSYVGASSRTKRLGDILNYGKAYMVSEVGVPQSAGSVTQDEADDNTILYHVYGDPTLEMWTQSPHGFGLPTPIEWDRVFTNTIKLKYAVDGTTITLLQEGKPLGRGVIENGEAVVKLVETPIKGEAINLSASNFNSLSRRLRPARATGKLNPTLGGQVKHQDSGFTINFPAGAVKNEVQLFYDTQIEPTQPISPSLKLLRNFTLNAQDDAGSEVSTFAADYTIELNYSDADVAGIDEQSLQCLYLAETSNTWKAVKSSVDSANNKVTCQADHFTEFALVTPQAESTSGAAVFLPLVVR